MSESSNASGIFALRVREAREMRGWSQSDLAEKSGLQPSAVSHFETGRRSPSFDNLKILADTLGVTTDFLLGRVESPGVVAPKVQQLFRDAEKMSAPNLEILAEMAKLLAKKQKP